MRFMILVKANEESETGRLPTEEELAEMQKFNEELVNEGIMLAGEGLTASSEGARVKYDGDKRTVIDGPFPETKELVAGFWIIKANSRDEAIAVARRIPFREGEAEIRKIFEDEDFAASDPSGELRKRESELRARVASQQQ